MNPLQQGSSLYQTIAVGYDAALNQAVTQQADSVLRYMAPTVQALLGLMIIGVGVALIMGRADFGFGVRKIITAIIVTSLLQVGNYHTWVIDNFTNKLPNEIAAALTDSPGTTSVYQSLDGIDNAVTHAASVVRQQCKAGWIGCIPDRITSYAVEAVGRVLLATYFVVIFLARATVAVLLPIGCLLLPFFMFDNALVRGFAERWVAVCISLILLQGIVLSVAGTVTRIDAQYMAKFAAPVASGPPSSSLQMNAGMLSYTGFSEVGTVGATGATTGAATESSANLAASLSALIGCVVTIAIGAAILTFLVPLTLFLGGAAGSFTASPALGAMGRGGMAAAHAVNRMVRGRR